MTLKLRHLLKTAALLATIPLLLGGCGSASTASGPQPAPGNCNLADYRTMVEQLAGDSGGHFAAGSRDNFKAMRYLESQFYNAGLVPGGEYGRYRQCFAMDNGGRACNVVGIIPGTGALATEAVVVAAHFDRHPMKRPQDVTLGADDNASGAAGLVMIARMLQRPVVSAPRRTMILVALNGSQDNRAGLKTYLQSPIVRHDKTKLAIVLHRIGRLEDQLKVTLTGIDDARRKTMLKADAKAKGVPVRVVGGSRRATCQCDDAAPLAAKGIPTMTVTTGTHQDVGKVGDNSHKLNWAGARKVLDTVAQTAHRAIYAL